MKKILYLVLVAVLTVTAGTAWGQHTLGNIPDGWTVTADGNPVTVTSNGTAAIPAGATVTLTPLYPAKVKSVKLKDEGLLNGKFSISATNQVYFSQGNLQATYNGSAWSWAFATNQWDYIGNAEGNTKLTATTPFVSDYTGTSTTVDLFGWVGASSTWEGAAQYGITSSTEDSGGADGYGNIVSESLKSDWGTLAITNGGNAANNGWRTLTIDEWEWILGPVYSSDPYYPSPSPNPGVNCRTSSTVGGTANARYAKATVADKPGLIIFPDSYTHPSDVTAPTNVNTYNADYTHNSYDATAWGKMESAGAVFLPAAGFRSGVTVNNAGLSGDYWSSSSISDVPQSAYRVWLSSTILDPRYYSLRNNGSSVRLVKDAQIVNLSTLTGDYEAQNGDILINTLAGNYKITIADGATVTLRNATINGTNNDSYQWAGITCLGDATIILEGTNIVKGFYENYPGIYVPVGKTLTIQGGIAGTGSLNASSNGYAAGIGGGFQISCGNIVITGGEIEATGGEEGGAGIGSGFYNSNCSGITISGGIVTATGGDDNAAGIGSGFMSGCGNITISGGTVNATGGEWAAGIGSGYSSSCSDITIANTVTSVTATKGGDDANSIGAGEKGTCGTVTIGGTEYYNGTNYENEGATYLAQSPLVYPAPPTGAINGKFSVSSNKQVYFSQGNLQYTKSTGVWSFMEHQYSTVETTGSYCTNDYGNRDVVSLFGWATSGYNHGATCYQPYSTNPTNENYYAYGDASYNLYDQTGQADWGYNAISNGGNTVNSDWRTLTTVEWQYLFANHTTGWSSVNGVNGYVIRPDGVSTAIAASYTASDWDTEEAAGAVFLPAAGYRNSYVGTDVYDKGSIGRYWSSSADGSNANYVNFSNSSLGPNYTMNRNYGLSVRLVKNAN